MEGQPVMICTLKRCAVTAVLVVSVGATNASTPQLSITTRALLTGLQEVPLAKTNGLGDVRITVLGAGGPITGEITTYRMHGTAAYIQEGSPGSNGPSIVTLQAGARGTWVIPEGSTLTPKQYQNFQAGDLYVNVDSNAYPKGEIRAQLNPDGGRPLRLTPLAPSR
jgi:hypothetical protein